jgi:phage gp16-like protein
MMSKMWNVFAVCVALSAPVLAQDAAAVSDEELKKYAVAMDSVNEMQAALADQIKTMVTSNSAMTAARYNEVFKVIGDENKLFEIQATPEEIAFVKQVVAKREEGTAKIKQAYQALAKEYVGASAFNKVKKALASDEVLKTKYQSLMDELAKDNTTSSVN